MASNEITPNFAQSVALNANSAALPRACRRLIKALDDALVKEGYRLSKIQLERC